MADLELITTSDGSHSLLNTKLQETYHSVHGAIQESEHVFIRNGLFFLDKLRHPTEIRILEIGFGTGLNALLALRYALSSNLTICYTALEAHPVGDEILTQLNYPGLLKLSTANENFAQLHNAPWEGPEQIQSNFILSKKMIRVQEWSPSQEEFDLVFFDAFAPSKQPEMWELPILKKIEQSMKKQGVFVTYCAKGQLKRDLRSLGMDVETLAGPPGKKEMVRATKS